MILERSSGWPKDRLSRVKKLWVGQTVACIASGPSLTVEQCEMVRAAGVHAITVNDSYRIAPWADLTYFADPKWFAWNRDREEWKAFAGQKCTIWSSLFKVDDVEVHVLKNFGGEGLSFDPTGIMTGSHSGYQVLNIAMLSGAKKILLLGYDCGRVNGKKHWFGDHPDGTEPPYDAIKQRYVSAQNPLAKAGCEVVNCSPGSFLKTFRHGDLREELAARVEPAAQGDLVSASSVQ